VALFVTLRDPIAETTQKRCPVQTAFFFYVFCLLVSGKQEASCDWSVTIICNNVTTKKTATYLSRDTKVHDVDDNDMQKPIEFRRSVAPAAATQQPCDKPSQRTRCT